jgi:hypothetical protein
MVIIKSDIVGKIRKAIDDIMPSNVTDSFVTDTDAELWQAVQHATMQLSLELPINLLDASVDALTGTINSNRGSAYSDLPDDYLRFVSIDIEGAAGILSELIEQGSEAEKMQRSKWSRATATKPKAMIDNDDNGDKVIVWWPGDTTHNSAKLSYIAEPDVTEEDLTTTPPTYGSIDCAIRDEAEQLIIYRAASIFFEGKKEETIAEKFRSLSTNY